MQAWADKIGKPKQETVPPPPDWLKARVETIDDGSMLQAYQIGKKQERGKEVAARRADIEEALADEAEEQNVSKLDVRCPAAVPRDFLLPVHSGLCFDCNVTQAALHLLVISKIRSQLSKPSVMRSMPRLQ